MAFEYPLGEAQYLELEVRGLDADLAARRGWHACGGPTEGVWIGIPYFDEGRRVGCKRRSLTGEKKFYSDTGSKQIFWNVDCLRDQSLKGQPLIITEGELDAEAAIEAGFPRTVSVPGGAPSEPPKDYEPYYLEHAASLLRDVNEIILAVDNDHAGQLLQKALADRLGRRRCRSVVYPAGKDLNDVLRKLGKGGVCDVLTTSEWIRTSSFFTKLSEMVDVTRPQPINVGIVGLDAHYRMRRGDLCVVTGAPGHGKTSFINNVVCNVAASHRLNACFASFEQHPTLEHRRALRSHHSRKLESDMSLREKEEADRWIEERFSFIWPDDDDTPSLPWVLERFATAVIQCKAAICVLDPWNELDTSDKPRDWTMTEYIHNALLQIKRFARRHDTAMIVAAHPRKLMRGKDGKMPPPGLWDIADSAAWANRCDVGLVIHRPDMMTNPETEISVVKSRYFNQIGRPGMIKGIWDETTTRYTITNDGAGME